MAGFHVGEPSALHKAALSSCASAVLEGFDFRTILSFLLQSALRASPSGGET